MEPVKTDRKWFKKKRYVIPAAALVAVVGLSNIGSHYQNAEQVVAPVPVIPTTETSQVENTSAVDNAAKEINTEVSKPKASSASAPQDNPPTSDVHYYENSAGNTVQSPTHYNEAPAGASAQCRDGSYSFSQSRSGTCSHHGGVDHWIP